MASKKAGVELPNSNSADYEQKKREAEQAQVSPIWVRAAIACIVIDFFVSIWGILLTFPVTAINLVQ